MEQFAKIKTQEKTLHLKEGFKPIVVCLDVFDDSKNIDFDINKASEIKNVDFQKGKYFIPERKEFLSAGKETYHISSIDNLDKTSDNIYACTSLVVTGVEKDTGENISFMTHQAPWSFLRTHRDSFIKDLNSQLNIFSKKCLAGSVDAVIVGGRDSDISNEENGITSDGFYEDSIKLLGDEFKKVFKDFEPVVVNGPKINEKKDKIKKDQIYFDNKNRRLYFFRPKVNSNVKDFAPSSFDENRKHWK